MKRRIFLQATLATAGGTLVGCNEETDSSTTFTPEPPRELTDGTDFFPQSVASGDPRPSSVILWTRLVDPAAPASVDLELELSPREDFSELISLNGQTSLLVTAKDDFDHCVKVRLAGVSPATVYYYRFIYQKQGKFYVSKVGRTKTAPADSADVTVKFAFVSCQDFNGRYYHAYTRLAQEDVDFVVHLGDYVYETNGDPTFQTTEGRRVEFGKPDEAIALTTKDGDTYYAARSIDNYRDLYRTYRSDPALQAIHETVPMIVTWDDHEFSDDCHGATASYFDGKEDEEDVDRRKAANQAWFEYMPVDYRGDPDFEYSSEADFPGDIKISRDFRYGRNLHLIMTDLRTFRADHVIAEDAYPGTVFADEATMLADPAAPVALARPYVDIDDANWAPYKTLLQGASMQGGGDPALVTGNISVGWINAVNAAAGSPAPPIDPTMIDPPLPNGLSYLDTGKAGLFTSIGSRYFVVKDVFDYLVKLRLAEDAKSQDVMGNEQEKWFKDTVKQSSATWKVWGNEYCVMPFAVDLTGQAGIPENFLRVFYMNCDAWDGFRAKRDALVKELAGDGNVVVITGDIHAFYAGTPWATGDPTTKIVEFVGSSVSSGTYRSLLISQVAADPVLSQIPQAGLLATFVDTLLKAAGVNPHLAYAKSNENGFSVVTVTAADFTTTYYSIPEDEILKTYDKVGDLDDLFKPITFRTKAGGRELFDEDGNQWNPETGMFE